MKSNKIMRNLFLIILLCAIFLTPISHAATTVTDENLNEALQKFVSSDSNEDGYEITVQDKIITISNGDEEYQLNYDLTNSPKFTYEVEIKQGMSYDEFQEKTGNLFIPMIGYLAVANVQGVEYEDSAAYIAMCLLQAAFSGSSSPSINNSYIIVEDGVSAETEDENAQVIKKSEFGNHVIEYAKAMYGEKKSFKDSSDFKTFEWTTELTDEESTSCKLVSTINISSYADFSKLNGYASQVNDATLNDSITELNADYLIKLKVGQKCNIISSETISGHELYGASCIDINETNTVITAKSVGKANGYLYVGSDNKKISVYITVEANSNNSILSPISITLGDGVNIEEPSENQISNDNTSSDQDIANTGSEDILIIAGICICIIVTIIFAITNKKYKEI